jgi:hypothetical protein
VTSLERLVSQLFRPVSRSSSIASLHHVRIRAASDLGDYRRFIISGKVKRTYRNLDGACRAKIDVAYAAVEWIPRKEKLSSSGELAVNAYHRSRCRVKERGVDRWVTEAA